MPKLTPEQRQELIAKLASGRFKQTELAAEYGISSASMVAYARKLKATRVDPAGVDDAIRIIAESGLNIEQVKALQELAQRHGLNATTLLRVAKNLKQILT